uniref:RNA binding motif protein 41 n=1 Tax=Gopherus evgoodei TaxID=1825980 RepID=A0A8C4WJH4_9SAUR
MRRINSSLSSDDLLLEDLETEGERQLKTLLHHQLDTAVSIEQCVSKRRCFAPAALYKPFGEEAAGTLTLSQFQALQESEKETASLRELGLSDSEILLWKNHASADKGSGLGAAPEAMRERLRAIQEKITERQRILSLPQRFAGSKQLNRREMEIENALFQGTDRHSFLRALYHQGVEVAREAMLLVNGYNLMGKTLVIEFGKSKVQSSSVDSASHSLRAITSAEKPTTN